MVINTSDYSDMTANLKVEWAKAYDEVEKRALQIYDVSNVDEQTGAISSLDGFTTAIRKREGEDFAYGDITQNYRVTWTQQVVGLMTKITWEMRRFDKYGEITARIRNMAVGAAKKFERDLTHRLTMMASTSYTDNGGNTITTTTGDGYALCYSAHTVNGSSTTYRNIVANNPLLSKGGLEAMELLLNNMIDDNGEHAPRKGTHIIVSDNPNTVNTAMEILKSTSDITSSNSGVINVYNGKYQLIILPYLRETPSTLATTTTYDKYWFLADLSPGAKRGFVKIAEEPKMVELTGNVEFDSQDWKYAARAAYDIIWLDGKNICGSKGDGSA